MSSLVYQKCKLKQNKIFPLPLINWQTLGSQALPRTGRNMITQEGSYSESNLAVKEAWQPFSSHKTFQVGNTHPSLHSPNHLEPKLSHCFLFKPLPVWLEGRQKQCERVRESQDTCIPLRSPSSNSNLWLIGSLRVRQGPHGRPQSLIVQSPHPCPLTENHASGLILPGMWHLWNPVIQWNLPLY